MKKYSIYAFLVFLILTVQFAQAQEKGIVKTDALVSTALGNNVTKEDTTRPLAIAGGFIGMAIRRKFMC